MNCCWLLVPQRLDRVELRGLERWEEPKQDADAHRDTNGQQDSREVDDDLRTLTARAHAAAEAGADEAGNI